MTTVERNHVPHAEDASATSVSVRDVPDESRYEIHVGPDLAGFVQYQLGENEIDLVHTETGPAFAGRGLAGQLVTATLDDVRRRGLAVVPSCPYVRSFIAKHPEYLDLVPGQRRADFGL